MEAERTLRRARPLAVYFLMASLLLQGVGGLFGGLALDVDPSGDFMQLPLSTLANTPFNDYLIPGLILMSVLGVFPIIAAVGLLFRPGSAASSGPERPARPASAWLASFTVGVALIIWIVIQVRMIGLVSPLQWIFFALGIGIVGLTLLPSVRRYYWYSRGAQSGGQASGEQTSGRRDLKPSAG